MSDKWKLWPGRDLSSKVLSKLGNYQRLLQLLPVEFQQPEILCVWTFLSAHAYMCTCKCKISSEAHMSRWESENQRLWSSMPAEVCSNFRCPGLHWGRKGPDLQLCGQTFSFCWCTLWVRVLGASENEVLMSWQMFSSFCFGIWGQEGPAKGTGSLNWWI